MSSRLVGLRRVLFVRQLAPVLTASLVAGLLGVPAFAAGPVGSDAAVQPDVSTPVSPVQPLAAQDRSEPEHQAVAPVFPSAAAAVVDLPVDSFGRRGAASVSVGGLPVRVSPVLVPVTQGDVLSPDALEEASRTVPSKVRVEVLDRATAAAARGVVALRVSRADGLLTAASVRVEVDYSAFRGAYGGDWASRLGLAVVPQCVLTTPLVDECAGRVWLPGSNDVGSGRVSAELSLGGDVELAGGVGGGFATGASAVAAQAGQAEAGEGSFVVLAAGAESAQGSFKKTDLKASYTWNAGTQAGDFSWSYPLGVPPVPGGLVPSVSLSYGSGAVDGQTGSENTQPGVLGEGWSYTPGYVERAYRTCSSDTDNSPYWTSLNGNSDNCYRRRNARIVLNGKSSELVWDNGDQTWRLQKDDGEKVQLLSGASNGDEGSSGNAGEHWKITTTDGTVYYFGLHAVPNRGVTNSVATVPVYANHSDEPCFSSSSESSSRCKQAYRWMLDYVVDRHGNQMVYRYERESNLVQLNGGSGSWSYTRAINPSSIEYGWHTSDASGVLAPAKVDFTLGMRCLSSCGSEANPTEANWFDTPWDLRCDSSPCGNNPSPSFWTGKRLAKIVTRVRKDATSYRPVDVLDLEYKFPETGNVTHPVLWLDVLVRRSYAADGVTSKELPAVEFNGVRLNNRAMYDPSFGEQARKYRVDQIVTETGGRIDVTYSGTDSDCNFGNNPPAADANSRRCFPQWVKPITGGAGWTWWHKYLVTAVQETDLVGGSPTVRHEYTYGTSASSTSVMWGHDNGAAVWSANLSGRSWGQWMGYTNVAVYTGPPAGLRSRNRFIFYRGLDGDRKNDGSTRDVSITDFDGNTYTDYGSRAGHQLASLTYDKDGGIPVVKTLSTTVGYTTGERDASGWATPATLQSKITRTEFEKVWDWKPATSSWVAAKDVRNRWNSTNGRLNSVSDTILDLCTAHTYTDNTSKHMLSFVSSTLVYSDTCDQAPTLPAERLSETRYWFDGQDHAVAPTVGNVTTVQGYVDDTATFTTTSTASYDPRGRTVWTKDGLGRQTSSFYTDVNGLTTTMRSQNAKLHETTATIDPGRGLPVAVEDANGKITSATYDEFGRLTSVTKPGNTTGVPDAAYQYSITKTAPSYIATKVLGPNGNQITSYEIFDGLLRIRQAQSTAPDGNRVIADSKYNDRGQLVKSSIFYNNASGPAPTLVTATDVNIDRQQRFTYDGQGRQTKADTYSKNVLKWSTTSSYGFRSVTVTPPEGGTVTTDVVDHRGRLVEKWQYNAGTPAKTIYTHDDLDQLRTVKDPLNNLWTYDYNKLGQQTTTTDPDAGTSTKTYDLAGQLATTTDARNITLAYAYDNLGRQTALHEGTLQGNKRAEWVYDTIAKGQLTSSTRFDNGLAYTTAVTGYDHGYRPLGSTVTIPASPANGALAGTYTVGMTYKVNGALATQTLPAVGGLPAETITSTYTTQGLPATTVGLDQYLASVSYAWDGAVTQSLHGTDLKRLRLINNYDPATGRLLSNDIDTQNQTNPILYDARYATEYGYDNIGNIRRIGGETNGVLDQIECFKYDDLRRLTDAWTQAAAPCAASPQRTGADPYQRSWTFDTIGNRTTQTDVSPSGTTTWNYTNGAAGSVKAHQVKQVTKTGPAPGASTRTFGYDAAGNTTSRTTDTGTTQTLTWDAEGNLATVTENSQTTSYVYDADGTRLIGRTPAKTTLYMGGTELELMTSGGAPLGTRYYGNAVRNATGLRWICADHNGTSQAQIDSVTLTANRRRTMPYGEERGTQATDWYGTKGYVDGTKDDTGLVHLGAREYDPTTGRFISIDPVMDLHDPQQWHAYTYSNGSPITFSDPTGLLWGEVGQFILGAKDGSSNYVLDTVKGGIEFAKDPKGVILRAVSEVEKTAAMTGTTPSQYPALAVCVLSGVCDIAQNIAEGNYYQAGYDSSQLAIDIALGAATEGLGTVATTTTRLPSIANKISKVGNGFCSFGKDTEVLMADGSAKPISQVEVGDLVVASDPVTGEHGDRPVTHLWIHQDQLHVLETESGALATTEDHPFWNATDQQWQRADEIDHGDVFATPDGQFVRVVRFVHVSARTEGAYNLTVNELHTYYVLAGKTPVLVHNTNGACDIPAPGKGPGSVSPADRDPKRLFTRNEVQEKLDDQGGVCAMCDEPLDLANAKGHHVTRHADGGPTIPDNLVVLCARCHQRIHM